MAHEPLKVASSHLTENVIVDRVHAFNQIAPRLHRRFCRRDAEKLSGSIGSSSPA
jgi:hypothetical protein